MFLDLPEANEPMDGDRVWARYQPFLRHRGYELRPRYQPEWQPSWKGKVNANYEAHGKYEDYRKLLLATTIDAIRIRDGVKVAIRCNQDLEGPEIPNLLYLNSPEARADLRNRTVPVLDILILPDRAFIVMPMLMFFHALPFRHLGELSEAIGQLLQGLMFMHEQRVVHLDACLLNIMMDPSKVVPGGFHFAHWETTNGLRQKISWKERWSVHPIDYFFIDFETSIRYLPLTYPPTEYMIPSAGTIGQDRTVPKFLNMSQLVDGFKADVYQLGNALRRVSICYEDLSVFDPLFTAMTARIPVNRASAAEAYQIFLQIVDSWSEEHYTKRIWFKGTTRWEQFLIQYFHKNFTKRLPDYSHFEPPPNQY